MPSVSPRHIAAFSRAIVSSRSDSLFSKALSQLLGETGRRFALRPRTSAKVIKPRTDKDQCERAEERSLPDTTLRRMSLHLHEHACAIMHTWETTPNLGIVNRRLPLYDANIYVTCLLVLALLIIADVDITFPVL